MRVPTFPRPHPANAVRRSAVMLCVLLSTSASVAPAQDAHLTGDSAPLVQRSAFLHGYLHGYEEGFHWGDQDYHLGRTLKDAGQANKLHKPELAYQSQFGDRKSFVRGFESGFRSGYLESSSGGRFRAFAAVKRVAEKLERAVLGLSDIRQFDNGFAAGYKAGSRHGPSDIKGGMRLSSADLPAEIPQCAADSKKETTEFYCDGFRRGYKLGYSDQNLPRPSPDLPATTATAKNAPRER